MPEIKHTFTSGKMNKDLDERLVPNGEYRDAMNVQITTSEGSDIGSVQNLLSNYKLPINFYKNSNYTCVGSIADEKSDTLYYFIAENSGWQPDHSSVVDDDQNHNPIPLATSINAGNYTPYNCKDFLPYFRASTVGDSIIKYTSNPVVGTTPTMDYVVKDIKYLSVNLVASNTYIPTSFGDGNNAAEEQYYVDFEAIQLIKIGMKIEMINVYDTLADGSPIDTIEYIGDGPEVQTTDFVTGAFTLKGSTPNFLVPYLSTSVGVFEPNKIIAITFVDNNRTLNFDASRNNITGINIIDDMLFWTDNHSEPKKNIYTMLY